MSELPNLIKVDTKPITNKEIITNIDYTLGLKIGDENLIMFCGQITTKGCGFD